MSPSQNSEVGSNIKSEPIFVGPDKIPSDVDFDAFCRIIDDENPNHVLVEASTSMAPTTTNNILEETPIKNEVEKHQERLNAVHLEMDFLREEKIALQTRLRSLEEQVYNIYLSLIHI